MHAKCSTKVGELEFDLRSVVNKEKKLLIELMPELLPLLKEKIKESAIDAADENDGVSAASARAPVACAVLAAYQLRWIVVQVTVCVVGFIGILCYCEIEEKKLKVYVFVLLTGGCSIYREIVPVYDTVLVDGA